MQFARCLQVTAFPSFRVDHHRNRQLLALSVDSGMSASPPLMGKSGSARHICETALLTPKRSWRGTLAAVPPLAPNGATKIAIAGATLREGRNSHDGLPKRFRSWPCLWRVNDDPYCQTSLVVRSLIR